MAKKNYKEKYLVYGEGCDNFSDMFNTEKEMIKEMKQTALDGDWDGPIIGYKLTPIYTIDPENIPVIKIPVTKIENK